MMDTQCITHLNLKNLFTLKQLVISINITACSACTYLLLPFTYIPHSYRTNTQTWNHHLHTHTHTHTHCFLAVSIAGRCQIVIHDQVHTHKYNNNYHHLPLHIYHCRQSTSRNLKLSIAIIKTCDMIPENTNVHVPYMCMHVYSTAANFLSVL